MNTIHRLVLRTAFVCLLCTACGDTSVLISGDEAGAVDDALRTCPSDNNPCTSETRTRGKCVSKPVADGTACGQGGTCSAGACTGSTPLPEVAVGETQTCARYPNGKVYCWGTNCEGGLGTGLPIDCRTIQAPAPVINLADATGLSGGDEHNCVTKADGTAACWGWNVAGALGNGDTTDQNAPVAVLGLSGVAKLGAGRTHTCAALTSGALYCWGDNFFGQLGNGRVGGYDATPRAVAAITDAIDVKGSEGDTCVLHRSGAVTCFGWHALRWAGTGSAYTGTPTAMPGISDAAALALGHDHACVAHSGGGSVSCWGNNSDGQLGTGRVGCPDGSSDCAAPGQVISGLSGITQLAGSYVHTCAVQSSGKVFCFGWLPVAAADGSISRQDVLSPVAVTGLDDAVQVSTSEIMDDVDCAVRSTGQIVCWGDNSLGQFGSATAPGSVTPVPVAGLP